MHGSGRFSAIGTDDPTDLETGQTSDRGELMAGHTGRRAGADFGGALEAGGTVRGALAAETGRGTLELEGVSSLGHGEQCTRLGGDNVTGYGVTGVRC